MVLPGAKDSLKTLPEFKHNTNTSPNTGDDELSCTPQRTPARCDAGPWRRARRIPRYRHR